MKHILNKLLDIIFPPRESELLLRTQITPPIETSSCYEGVFFCTHYSGEVIKAAVTENKFYNSHTAQQILADCFSRWVHAQNLSNICVIPIPLGARRETDRGHNQVLSVLQSTAFPYCETLLTRQIESVPQTTLPRAGRLKNVRRVFSCNAHEIENISQPIIILLDDVVTTGATLNEARATLAPHLPPNRKLICVALAH